ncbi:hypothetical protein AVEN_175349-1 [Araneus ventricosus]|uniref:NTR domain-containing protein n=1 Tax=Araneus ventricosus TaxID=182803 RepID=A0A4Y2U931_ARAVE|nr:hypothetical protein AVEN_175349-1 [Araneus ventricosus]
MHIATVCWRAFRLFYSSEYGWRLTVAEIVASRKDALRKLWQSPKRNFVLTFSRWTPVINQRCSEMLCDIYKCRPCSEEQLLHHYCSSDFVFQGKVTDLFHNKLLQVTELTVHISKTHRTNELQKFPSISDSEVEPKYVILQRPLKCGTKAGSGEYLFLGKWILGNPSLDCIPRITEWKKVRRKALMSRSNECLLNL